MTERILGLRPSEFFALLPEWKAGELEGILGLTQVSAPASRSSGIRLVDVLIRTLLTEITETEFK